MTVFHLPDLGEGLAEAEIREWYVKVGDEVTVDQPLVSLETAKAVVDVPAPYAGRVTQLHGKVNDIIKTHAPLITIETNEAKGDKATVVGKLEVSEKKWSDDVVSIGVTKNTTPTIKAMPVARVLAKEMHVDLNLVTPTGPNGLITAEDVKNHLMQHAPSAISFPGAKESLHGVRRAMALAMTQAHQQIVPVTIVDDADISNLPAKGDLTVHVLKAIVFAVQQEPSLNAWFDGNTMERQLFSECHIGLAMDTKEGLFVPVIKHVETLSPTELRTAIDEYKEVVGARTITPDKLHGATITLSNYGMITGRYATPIVVPPMVAILGCGRSRESAIARDGKITTGRILPLSLTFDHRAVTGGEATRFLAAVIKSLAE